MSIMKKNLQRSKNLISILKINLWMSVWQFPFFLYQYFVFSKYDFDPVLLSWDSLPPNYNEPTYDLVSGVWGLAYLVILIMCYVRFIKWFRRAYFNLEASGVIIDNSESTAAWAWFVPIYNLFAPYQIMKELWVKTQKTYIKDPKPINNLISWWWGVWIFNFIVDGQLDGIGGSLFGDNLETISLVNIFMPVAWVFSAYLAIKIVQQVSEFEELMYFKNKELFSSNP